MTIDDDDAGKDVVVAARIGALAGADQILISANLAERLPGTTELASCKFARQKSKLAGTIRGSYFVIKDEY